MIRNLEIRKDKESYVIVEKALGDSQPDQTVHTALSESEAEEWLLEQGAIQADVTRALTEIESAARVYVEIGEPSASEGFPKQG